jgi:vancomycin resistance protein VanJ
MKKPDVLIRLVLAVCNLYGALITLLLIARFMIGERPIINGFYSPVGTLNSMFAVALLPSMVTVFLCLVLRRPRSAALQLLPLVMLVATYGGNFLPRTSALSDDAGRIRVMSYNLYFANTRYDQILRIIRDAEPDIVALQELSSDTAHVLSGALAIEYPYQKLHPLGASTNGGGLLSRYPVLEDEAWEDAMMQQRTVLQIGDEQVVVFNVHPPVPVLYGANVTFRSAVIRRILARSTQESGRVLLIGDFNMGDMSEDYTRVTQHYDDAFRSVGYGLGLSFPDWGWRQDLLHMMPVLSRIDYIFYSEGFQALKAWTSHTSGGSDHRPVYAELAFVEQ